MACLPLNAYEVLEVIGELSATDYDGAGKEISKISTEFQVEVGPRNWRIRADYGPKHYSVHGSDGTNVYSYLSDLRNQNFQMLPGAVVPGGYPLDSTWYVTLPWLAYASENWLRDRMSREEDVRIPAVWAVPVGNPLAGIYRCPVKLNKQKPNTAETVEFIVDSKLLEQVGDGTFHMLGSVPFGQRDIWLLRSASFAGAAGFPEAEFRVLEFTNFAGWRVPASFELLRYNIFETNRSATKLLSHFTGSLKSVRTYEGEVDLPRVDRPIYVVDFRFANKGKVDAVKYAITNSVWKSDNDPALAALFREALAKGRTSRRFGGGTLAFIRISFVCIVVGLPTICVLLKKRKKSTKPYS